MQGAYMQGGCLCGAIRFELAAKKLSAFQCHCSLCRKQTGTAASCGSIINAADFSWLQSDADIATWVKDTGLTAHFCKICGSTVPNKFRGQEYYWIPVGLVDNANVEIVANIFVADSAMWSPVSKCINPIEGRPDIDQLIQLMCGEKTRI